MQAITAPRIRPIRPVQSARHQHGIVLIIALVLLVVIGFSSTFIMRNALVGELITNNLSSNQAANHAAETALRYCENELMNQPSGVPPPVLPAPDVGDPVQWQTAANWSVAGQVITVPDNVLQGASGITYRTKPQCMIERISIFVANRKDPRRQYGFQITARGFSPDYQAPSNEGTGGAGSEVVLQSTLRTATCVGALNGNCE
jgi:type IV pilus assembly protein PilX